MLIRKTSSATATRNDLAYMYITWQIIHLLVFVILFGIRAQFNHQCKKKNRMASVTILHVILFDKKMAQYQSIISNLEIHLVTFIIEIYLHVLNWNISFKINIISKKRMMQFNYYYVIVISFKCVNKNCLTGLYNNNYYYY